MTYPGNATTPPAREANPVTVGTYDGIGKANNDTPNH
jgi:hypothetical protein